MDEMESKLNAILGNPEMMQQIMSMAQSLGASGGETKQTTQAKARSDAPTPPQMNHSSAPNIGMDMATIQKIAGMAQRSGIDQNQRALLRALQPYLSRDRISKLERAMRAAKIASAAGFALGGQTSKGR